MKPSPRSDDSPAAAAKAPLSSLMPIVRIASVYRSQWALALLFLVLAAAATLSVPVSFRELIDRGFEDLVTPFVGLLALAIFMALATSARFYLMTWIGERVVADLRSQVFSAVLDRPPVYFETLRPGEVLSRLTADTTLIQALVGTSVSLTLRSAVTLLGGVTMMIFTSPALAGLMVLLLLLVILPVLALGRQVRKASRESQDRVADATALAGELLHAMPTVQSFGREPFERRRFAEAVELAFETAKDRVRRRSILTALAIVLAFSVMVLVLWLGARQVVAGDMSAGELAQFVLYAVFTAGAIAALAEQYGDLQRAAGATERLIELLGESDATTGQEGLRTVGLSEEAEPLPGPLSIEFSDVVFRYPSRPETLALDCLQLEVPAGRTVALVGASGAGKSTVFQMLLGFYTPEAGEIRVNGQRIQHWGLERVRASIGLVPQDPVLFSDNARENIRYGRLSATDAEVEEAARAASAHEFLLALPDGYETFLGERGIRLSGGQRQRIAIARAILRNPPILLLDEATSALDTVSERAVQAALESLLPGRTALVIAHRLSTVQKADEILVMDHGQLVARGTHAQLLESSPRYQELAGEMEQADHDGKHRG